MTNPIPGCKFGAKFRQKGKMWVTYGWHTGQDLEAPVGTPIYAARAGTVISANTYDRFFGYKVVINCKFTDEKGVKHDYDFWYCHMPKDAAKVKKGQVVKVNQLIGAVGVTGNTSGAHCHLEIRSGDKTFKAENFRDPMIQINYQPTVPAPKPVPKPNYVFIPNTMATGNLACYNHLGLKTHKVRFPKIAAEINTRKPNVMAIQELGKKDYKGSDPYNLLRKLLPDYYFHTGTDGRYVISRKDLPGRVFHQSFYTLPTKYKGDDKQIAILGREIYGVKGFYISLHLENEDATGNTQVKQFSEAYARGAALCKTHGVSLANLFIMGDMNSENKVRERAERLKYASAFEVSKSRTFYSLDTINHWKQPTKGPHSDYIFVRHSGATNSPVSKATQVNKPTLTDHGLVFVTGSLLTVK